MLSPSTFESIALWAVLGISFLGLGYAWLLRQQVLKEDMGTERMLAVWNPIRLGANEYLSRQTKVMMPLIVILTFVLYFSVYVVPPSLEAVERFAGRSEGASKRSSVWAGPALLCSGLSSYFWSLS